MTAAEAMADGLERAGFRVTSAPGDAHHPRLTARAGWRSWVAERGGLRVVLVADARGTPQDIGAVHDASIP